jgi:hypothetical protein
MKRIAAVLLSLAVLCGSHSEYVSAKQKLEMIEKDRLRSGARVALTPGELNAYVRQEIMPAFPAGVREPKLELGNGIAHGSALVDFGKVRRAQGKPPGWLASKLLDGERPVRVTAHVRSGRGFATVDVDSVEISGFTIDGRTLDFLIRQFLLPNYPQAKIGEPFALGHSIDRLEIKPARVDVVIGAGR